MNSRRNNEKLESLQTKYKVSECSHNPLPWVCCGSKRDDSQDEYNIAPLDIVQPVQEICFPVAPVGWRKDVHMS